MGKFQFGGRFESSSNLGVAVKKEEINSAWKSVIPACGPWLAVDFPTSRGRLEVRRKFQLQCRYCSQHSGYPQMT